MSGTSRQNSPKTAAPRCGVTVVVTRTFVISSSPESYAMPRVVAITCGRRPGRLVSHTKSPSTTSVVASSLGGSAQPFASSSNVSAEAGDLLLVRTGRGRVAGLGRRLRRRVDTGLVAVRRACRRHHTRRRAPAGGCERRRGRDCGWYDGGGSWRTPRARRAVFPDDARNAARPCQESLPGAAHQGQPHWQRRLGASPWRMRPRVLLVDDQEGFRARGAGPADPRGVRRRR